MWWREGGTGVHRVQQWGRCSVLDAGLGGQIAYERGDDKTQVDTATPQELLSLYLTHQAQLAQRAGMMNEWSGAGVEAGEGVDRGGVGWEVFHFSFVEEIPCPWKQRSTKLTSG